MGELYAGTYVVYSNVKVRDFMVFWLEYEMRTRITSGSYETYHNIVYNHIIPAKTFTKQEIGLKTESSYRTIPIPDYVFEAILEERKRYERNRRRRLTTFQDLDYICCSSYGRPRSKDFHWKHYKKLLQENELPNIRWHDLRSTFCTLLLKNNFNPKAVSQLMGHAKEIITIDVYGDTAEIIEDCLDEMQPFIDEVLPEAETEQNTDFSEEDYMECVETLLV